MDRRRGEILLANTGMHRIEFFDLTGKAVGTVTHRVETDDGTLIALVGVSDLVVIKAGDAVLVIPRDQAQDVRKVGEALSARGLARYL